jgi:aminopeptidase
MADAARLEPEQVLDPAALARYADLLTVTCLSLEHDDILFLTAHPEQRQLVVALAEAGYRAGARLVDIAYEEPRAAAARVRYVTDEHLGLLPDWQARRLRASKGSDRASLFVVGEADPGVFDGLAPERVAADVARRMQKIRDIALASLDGRIRWTGCAWPTDHWAGQVYPGLDTMDAKRRLAADILWFCRLGPGDPVDGSGWVAHATMLAARARTLTELGLKRLRYHGPGTDLEVGLSPGTVFVGGRRSDAYGHVISANVPTEECYTSPQAGAAAGTFHCSLPLSFRGRLIEGIAGEFRGGRLVRLEAANDTDRDFLAAFLDSEPNARRLGEVALVDASSRIGQRKRVYFNTLLDENAAAHIAFGAGFGVTRRPDARRGVNRANLHIDVMIGTDDLEVTGTAADGASVPVIAGGVWQI